MADTTSLERFARREPAAAAFVERALLAAGDPSSVAFRAIYASITRRLGATGAAPPIRPPELSDARPHWSLVDWLRLALLERALGGVEPGRQADFVRELFEAGELGEQESLLRTLVALPDPARFVDTGLLACRTNAKRVFEAMACENAYPARFFPELGFNQLVLKAVFIEVPVSRIEGLEGRLGPELARMARDYASERRAAGRAVPDDIVVLLGERKP